jgi:uncharacterized surface protein with fasciclin (FAS1) repeats
MKKVSAPLLIASLAALALTSPVALAEGCGKSAKLTKANTTQSTAKANIVGLAAGAGQFGTLLAAAKAAGLAETLAGPGPLTVFAPTDAAFAALPKGTVERLLHPENKHELVGLLKLHVISGKVTSDQLAGRIVPAKTLNGTVIVDGTNGVRVGNANVITADLIASNGVVHVIDRVLIPNTGV